MNWMDILISRALPGAGQSAYAAVSGTEPSIAAEDDRLYLCGEVSVLTLSSLPPSGLFEVIFASGATAAQIVFPNNVLLPDGICIPANSICDLSVRVCSVGEATYGLAALQAYQIPAAAAE